MLTVRHSAIAGLVQHYRSKSRGRSQSRLKTGGEIAAAALAGAAGSKLWDRHKDKKAAREQSRDLDDGQYYSDPDHRDYRSRSRTRSRSHSHSRSGTHRSSTYPREANPELGLVEYGDAPLSPSGYGSASDDRRPRHRHHTPSHSPSVASDKAAKKKRSRSRLRDAAVGVLGAGAAAIGLKKYNDAKKEREKSRERDRSRDRSRDRGSEDIDPRDGDDARREERRRQRRSRERERRRMFSHSPV
jgi:hypothetical protein